MPERLQRRQHTLSHGSIITLLLMCRTTDHSVRDSTATTGVVAGMLLAIERQADIDTDTMWDMGPAYHRTKQYDAH